MSFKPLVDLPIADKKSVPGAGVAYCQDYRVTDLVVDFCEHVNPLGDMAVARIVEMFVQADATAKVSSININGSFGDYDKLTMAERCLREVAEVDINADNDNMVFVGDSPNDTQCLVFPAIR